jgi:hypothetical protein
VLCQKISRTVLVAVLASAVGVSGCGASDRQAPGGEVDSAGSSAAGQSPSAAETAFTQQELGIYREARGRYGEYVSESAPIWSLGRATPASKSVFQEYYLDWQTVHDQLRSLESNGVTLHGPHPVGWTRPADIASDAVTMEQCVLKDAVVRKDGNVVPAQGPEPPYVVSIVLRRASVDGEFKIDTAAPTGASC